MTRTATKAVNDVKDNETKPAPVVKRINGEDMTCPAWLREGEGHADIELIGELDISGAKVKSVRIREPLVQDEMAAQKSAKDQGERELALFANLIGVAPSDLYGLRSRDYRRIQFGYMFAFTD
jgi:hypothetical protein